VTLGNCQDIPLEGSGYTLPVFAAAAAVAALRCLQHQSPLSSVELDLLEPPQRVAIALEQCAPLGEGRALAICRSDPGANLDLTRNTPVWAEVELNPPGQAEPLVILGGEGIGIQASGQAAIYRYARRLLTANLLPLLGEGDRLQVRLILPEGRRLAERTSNAAFGVVEGLSLLGTSGIAAALSTPETLAQFCQTLGEKAAVHNTLVFCLGENGLDLARQWGIDPNCTLKTANWLGPLLVEAGRLGVEALLLLGYHGKLIKLAGGIFHTHHHLADGRREILTAYAALAGLPRADLQTLFEGPLAETALTHLRRLGEDWVERVYVPLAEAIDQRSNAYVRNYCERSPQIGCVLFDRQRQRLVASQQGERLLAQLCANSSPRDRLE
jgi:cobalt-precorrin-5B (C1)-methyltransferase